MSNEQLISNEPSMLAVDTDKLTEEFTLKIPAKTKKMIKALDPPTKKTMNHEILLAIARVLHRASFDPGKYLKTEDEE